MRIKFSMKCIFKMLNGKMVKNPCIFFFIKYSDVHKIKANKIKEYHGIMHMKMYIISVQTFVFY